MVLSLLSIFVVLLCVGFNFKHSLFFIIIIIILGGKNVYFYIIIILFYLYFISPSEVYLIYLFYYYCYYYFPFYYHYYYYFRGIKSLTSAQLGAKATDFLISGPRVRVCARSTLTNKRFLIHESLRAVSTAFFIT